MKRVWFKVADWLWPAANWRRYRVAPRVKASVLREDLLREIQLEMKRTDLLRSRPVTGGSSR